MLNRFRLHSRHLFPMCRKCLQTQNGFPLDQSWNCWLGHIRVDNGLVHCCWNWRRGHSQLYVAIFLEIWHERCCRHLIFFHPCMLCDAFFLQLQHEKSSQQTHQRCGLLPSHNYDAYHACWIASWRIYFGSFSKCGHSDLINNFAGLFDSLEHFKGMRVT